MVILGLIKVTVKINGSNINWKVLPTLRASLSGKVLTDTALCLQG